MCFSPKIKMPKTNPSVAAVEPAPLKDEVQGVQFGSPDTEKDDDTEGTEVSGKKGLKVDLKKPTNGGAKRMSIKSRMGGKK